MWRLLHCAGNLELAAMLRTNFRSNLNSGSDDNNVGGCLCARVCGTRVSVVRGSFEILASIQISGNA